jgi:poly(A) polymerase/tRNA nucleotidyltransferase (CCA-adding enzyme)
MIALPGIDALWDALPEARIAGGAVRDSLAGRAVADVDFASPLTPDEVSRRLRTAGIKTVPTGLAHGTVTAVVGGRGFEITTLRRDVATDGRHATVAFTDDWRADAARRDFTINAMFLDRAGRIFDFFEGQADLAAGVVRFVGAADERIAEDYLRILRYFRFFARYAAGAPDAAAVAAIAGQRAGILGLSGCGASLKKSWRRRTRGRRCG